MLPAEDRPTPLSTAQLSTAPLSTAMREGSRADHERAEGAGFVGDLMAGRVDPARYVAYLRRLRVVYAALEQTVWEHRAHPAVAAVHDASLFRSDALDRDLELWSAAVPGAVPPQVGSPAAAAYRERIELAGAHPHLLVAHHYTRYLGDLSGGRMLAQALSRSHPALAAGGLAFYEFPTVPKPVAYKRAYRARLDALHLDPAARIEVVEEVRYAFDLNRRLLDELSVPEQAPALCR